MISDDGDYDRGMENEGDDGDECTEVISDDADFNDTNEEML